MRSGSATPIQLAPHWDMDKVNFWSQIAFAFGGLELGAILGGEIRNPARNVPRAAWISGSCIAAFYILGTLSLMVLMPPARISILTGLVQASTEAGARLHSVWLGPAMIVLILAGVAGQHGLRDRAAGRRKPACGLPVIGRYDGNCLLHSIPIYVRCILEVRT